MKIKTKELVGPTLDWAVAKIEKQLGNWPNYTVLPAYSTEWAQGGPIIGREKFDVQWQGNEHCRVAYDWLDEPYCEGFGPTPLIAAMRCFVASKLGDEIDIPEELL